MIKELNKNGIALLSLTIVIIVLMLISGMVTYVSYDIITDGKKAGFLHDIDIVNAATDEYYVVNGSYPILETGTQVTANEFEEKINELYDNGTVDILKEELTQNNDLNAIFYEIDITKLNIETSNIGLKKDENDIFLISSNNNIYYYSGYRILNDIYFSNSKIIDKNN